MDDAQKVSYDLGHQQELTYEQSFVHLLPVLLLKRGTTRPEIALVLPFVLNEVYGQFESDAERVNEEHDPESAENGDFIWCVVESEYV